MSYQGNAARCDSVPYTARMEQCATKILSPAAPLWCRDNITAATPILIISCALLVRFSTNWNHWIGHGFNLHAAKNNLQNKRSANRSQCACLKEQLNVISRTSARCDSVPYTARIEQCATKILSPAAPLWCRDNFTAATPFWSYLALYSSDFLQIETIG